MEIQKWGVIICGGSAYGDEQEDLVNATILAFRTLLQHGYSHETIYYLSVVNYTDADGDGQNDVDAYASKQNVLEAITGWLVNHSDFDSMCFIYIASHGGTLSYEPDGTVIGYFVLDSDGNGYIDYKGGLPVDNERVMDSEIAYWTNQLTYGTLAIVIEACFSGSFIDNLSNPNYRIVITSTTQDKGAMNDTIVKDIPCFTYGFFISLNEGNSIGEAFNDGWQRVQDQWGNTALQYDPLLDDNGDGEGRVGPVPHWEEDEPPRDGELAIYTWP